MPGSGVPYCGRSSDWLQWFFFLRTLPDREVRVSGTIERLRSEFLEMPGLRLTKKQVQRLCGIDEASCTAALNALVDLKFLRVNADGSYARTVDGLAVALRPAAARLNPRLRQAS
jgi:hypothetical protein